jgi:phosphatidylethanolamine-binding protein (PEBP) family uncharacterized protein
MAQGTGAVGGLATVAVVLALVVAGCGGGGSSASGTSVTGPTAGGVDKSQTESQGATSQGGGAEGQNASKKPGGSANPPAEGKKKHPPLKLPAGKPEQAPTEKQSSEVPVAILEVSSPQGGLTAENTCEGKNISPALTWKNVPKGTVELAVFVMNLQPVEGKLYFDWAIAGIDPASTGLKAGEVPAGAVVGRNSAGKNDYSLCPSGAGPENYIFAVYAISKSLAPKSGFEPLEFRAEATDASQSNGLYSVTY